MDVVVSAGSRIKTMRTGNHGPRSQEPHGRGISRLIIKRRANLEILSQDKDHFSVSEKSDMTNSLATQIPL
jgi:hypothetical protein